MNNHLIKSKILTFEDILAWQKARSLSISVYQETNLTRDYSFRDQLRRASVSVMNNIAEGYERNTDKEFRQFLFIAKGSCGEVRSMLNLAHELDYIDAAQYQKLDTLSKEVSQLIAKFIKALDV